MTDSYTSIRHATEIAPLLEELCHTGIATLVPEHNNKLEMPIVVKQASFNGLLKLDISTLQGYAKFIQNGHKFHLAWLSRRGLVRTPALAFDKAWEENGRLYCQCKFPDHIQKRDRRAYFRAQLREGMYVKTELIDREVRSIGWLKDLSLTGCRVSLEPSAINLLQNRQQSIHMEMTFPNGQQLTVNAWPHRYTTENDRIFCGFSFSLVNQKDERTLWTIVNETEREANRNDDETLDLQPSSLYSGASLDSQWRTSAEAYTTPMGRYIARQAVSLATQVLKMHNGNHIDSAMLSNDAERLVVMHEKDREALLFALASLYREPQLIRHSLSVAIHLLDISTTTQTPWKVRKAIAAAAMVHDLGKALIPASLIHKKELDKQEHAQLKSHVPLIKARLANCQWIPEGIATAIIEGANERLDGSGYPKQQRGGELNRLARMIAVIDMADALGRHRPDRQGVPADQVHRTLRQTNDQLDQSCVEHYIKHFGQWPVGTLLQFPDNKLGWVVSLNQQRELATVKFVSHPTPPDITDGTLISDNRLTKVGAPIGAIMPAF